MTIVDLIVVKPPLWGSCRLTMTLLLFWAILHIFFMRFNFSMAIVCMTGVKKSNNVTEIEVIMKNDQLYLTL